MHNNYHSNLFQLWVITHNILLGQSVHIIIIVIIIIVVVFIIVAQKKPGSKYQTSQMWTLSIFIHLTELKQGRNIGLCALLRI